MEFSFLVCILYGKYPSPMREEKQHRNLSYHATNCPSDRYSGMAHKKAPAPCMYDKKKRILLQRSLLSSFGPFADWIGLDDADEGDEAPSIEVAHRLMHLLVCGVRSNPNA